MSTIKVTDQTFEATVLGAPGPVLVDFWATWCGPCLAVAPILEQLSTEYAGKVTIAKLDVDESPQTAARYRIQSIPTMILFEGGKPKTAVQGALPKPKLVEFLEKSVSSLKPPAIKPAELKAALDAGEPWALYDVRDPGPFSRGHLLRSARLAPEDVAATLATLPAGRNVALICRSGEVSSELAAKLNSAARRVVALEKGLLAWEGSGFPTYSDQEEKELSGTGG